MAALESGFVACWHNKLCKHSISYCQNVLQSEHAGIYYLYIK